MGFLNVVIVIIIIFITVGITILCYAAYTRYWYCFENKHLKNETNFFAKIRIYKRTKSNNKNKKPWYSVIVLHTYRMFNANTVIQKNIIYIYTLRIVKHLYYTLYCWIQKYMFEYCSVLYLLCTWHYYYYYYKLSYVTELKKEKPRRKMIVTPYNKVAFLVNKNNNLLNS